MNANAEVLLHFLRVGIAIALVPVILLLTLALVGIGNATTTATAAQLWTQAAAYAGLSLLCVGYGIKGRSVWLAWMLIGLVALPPLVLFVSFMRA